MTTTFDGAVTIVTGGASGIGLATARRLRADGANVAVFDRDSDSLTEPDLMFHRVDITDHAAVEAATTSVVKQWGRIDVLVNCAGIGASGTITDSDDDEWRQVFEVNVLGTVHVTRAALPYLLAAPAGNVVNVASAVALTGFPNRALYSATKGAIVALTRAAAADYLSAGVRFNAVCPGTTETPWILRLLEAADDAAAERARLEERQPHGRLVRPEEVADAIAYLANPLAQSTNGVVLSVDAGIESVYVPH